MRHIVFAIFGIGMVAIIAGPKLAQSQGTVMACRYDGRPCIPTTAQKYNYCVQLALRRGQDLTKGDRHSLDRFVYSCVAGRVTN
jgi:hypothetical protein